MEFGVFVPKSQISQLSTVVWFLIPWSGYEYIYDTKQSNQYLKENEYHVSRSKG